MCLTLHGNDKDIDALYSLSVLPLTEKTEASYLKKIDSIQTRNSNNQYISALSDILRADYYTNIGDYKRGKSYLEKSSPLVKELQNPKLTLEYNYQNIYIQRSANNIDEAVAIAKEVFDQSKNIWPKQKQIHLLLELGYLHSFKYKYDEAMEYLQQALQYAEESNDYYKISEVYNLLGILYSEINDELSSIMYFEKAIDIKEKRKELKQNSFLYNNLADSYRLNKEYEKSKVYIEKALLLARKENNKNGLSFGLQIKSRLHTDLKEYEIALESLLEASILAEEVGEELFQFEIQTELTDLYIRVKDLDKAKQHLALALTFDGNRNDDDKYYLDQLKAKIFAEEGNHQEAYKALKDSYREYIVKFNDELTKVSNTARKALDTERLSFENKLLARENELSQKNAEISKKFNTLLWVSIAVLIITVLILLIFLKKYKAIATENNRLALTDNLTGLPNRRHVFRALKIEHELNLLQGISYSLILFDLDHFKSINDRFGHHVGDGVIKLIKDVCNEVLRKNDFIGRIGGEEFLIVLPRTEIDQASQVAERIRKSLEDYPFEKLIKSLTVSASFGVTQATSDDETIDFVVNRADRLLYKAKKDGRNRVAHSFD